MSMFDAYTTTEAVEIKRQFLNEPKKDFLRKAGLIPANERKRGRQRRYDADAVMALDARVNQIAQQAEGAGSLNERLAYARDYQLMTDADLARAMSVSRELVRQWRQGIVTPRNTEQLASVLGVPHQWLMVGGEDNLPADSAIGVRVGDESMRFRDLLREETKKFMGELPKDTRETFIQNYLEALVRGNQTLSRLARRAGGRWQFITTAGTEGGLVFAPWVPLPERGLMKRFWSDEVEALIAEKMSSGKSVYAASKELTNECSQRGWRCPVKISLYSRLQAKRERIKRYGINIKSIAALEPLGA